MDILIWGLIVILFLLTYIGIVIPLIPDILCMVTGFLLYHFFLTGPELGMVFWISTLILSTGLFFIEYLFTGMAVKKSGGSKSTMFAAMAGLLLFPFILGPFGIILGPFLAVLVLEWLKTGRLTVALSIAWGTFLGLLRSVVAKFFVITLLIGWFLILVLR